MNEQESSRAKQAWTYALIMVSVVALVIAVAGLLRPSPDPELTTAPMTSTAEPATDAPVENKTAQEPVDVSAPIPGCETVLPPTEPILSAFTSSAEPSYDNPKFPWFNGPKATAMSDAVAELLPDGAEVEFASPMQSLIFQPIDDYGESAPEFNGITIATGSIVNRDARGDVTVQVHQSSLPIPPCVAGNLDERRTLTDGSLVDVHDTWHELNGIRTLIRSAQAYTTDGTWIHAISSDAFTTTQQENSGSIPLTTDDLMRIVTDPRLRVSTSVPPGTPAPAEGCRDSAYTSGPAITREQARKLDAILATVGPGGEKLPPLQLSMYSDSTLCTGLADAKT